LEWGGGEDEDEREETAGGDADHPAEVDGTGARDGGGRGGGLHGSDELPEKRGRVRSGEGGIVGSYGARQVTSSSWTCVMGEHEPPYMMSEQLLHCLFESTARGRASEQPAAAVPFGFGTKLTAE
jgi:hypothetical protein